jgi:methyl-accepting chemotaxis protein
VTAADNGFASDASTATWVLIGFIVFSLLVGVAFAARLAGSIKKRLAKLTEVADRLSRGDVDGLEVDVTGTDEVGQLGESLQGVIAAFQELFQSSMKRAA